MLLFLFLAAANDCQQDEYWDAPMQMCMKKTAASDFADSNPGRYDAMLSPEACSGYFHFGMAMCLPKPKAFGRFSGTVMGNVFAVFSGETGPRGDNGFAAPDWLMTNLGFDFSSWNRLELDLMLTAELWTYPDAGYPQLLQIGENNASGAPYVDEQHPHSSPLMGLSVSEVFSFSQTKRRVLRLWFAPRGESTDGPIAFMHRATGTVNPDAPLGHHVGEDVGHVSSTVIGASLFVGDTTLEASAFHGQEPDPTQIDLPIGAPDSFALRLVQHFGAHASAAASFAYVNNPENDPAIAREERVSASAYLRWYLPRAWRTHATLIWGGILGYDHAAFLSAVTAENVFLDNANTLYDRLEILQRTPAELQIATGHPFRPQWVGALSAGYTRLIVNLWFFDFSLGGEVVASAVPGNFTRVYGGPIELTVRAYVELRWMFAFAKMFGDSQ